ncbi:sensor histidine kinase [Paenibacillus thermoaerophilus]|uniref:Signal transduction histidine-protein kinase/phosphatase DegS n=1 Tax=Paenibacillus thermoaerophilus TaxID=1215385 RepID=A0ABW2V4Y3_9BACL|nr:sensor histidine kinase [Paenibacillus thermoaerophilus]TMV12534.1 histidine kinase [Paenibacillus thermoaerophilus]
MQADAIDQIIKNAIRVMEDSKYQIYEISQGARSEYAHLKRELDEINKTAAETIEMVDKLEVEFRRARIRLTEVSRDFNRYNEADIRTAYEQATSLQLQLSIFREKEQNNKIRRDDIQRRLKNVEKTVERAEVLVSQINVVLEYLSGDLNQVTRILESAKNRQQLGFKIILAQEEERRRISREIHDDLAQSLAHIVLRAEIAERMLMKQDLDAVRVELSDMKSQIRSSLEEVRKMIFNLRPMALDDLGLAPALRKYIQDFEERTKIHADFEVFGKEVRLPSPMEVAIYRLVQESFSNVYKHARATYIRVELTFQRQMVRLIVQDNGVGFQVGKDDAEIGRFGLMGMRERVELLEGELQIESAPDRGTKISLAIPISVEQKEEY